MLEAACATCDFYLDDAAALDGIPYWDTGAPGLTALGDWRARPSDPFNDHEPVDSSAAAIGAQGLLRLGRVLNERGGDGTRYEEGGLRVLATLLDEPYLSTDAGHQRLLLHAIYHRGFFGAGIRSSNDHGLLESDLMEEPERADRDLERTRRQVSLPNQVDLIGANLLRAKSTGERPKCRANRATFST
jgi:hypothetical protein